MRRLQVRDRVFCLIFSLNMNALRRAAWRFRCFAVSLQRIDIPIRSEGQSCGVFPEAIRLACGSKLQHHSARKQHFQFFPDLSRLLPHSQFSQLPKRLLPIQNVLSIATTAYSWFVAKGDFYEG